jgi:hypothetical protein
VQPMNTAQPDNPNDAGNPAAPPAS